MIDRRDRTSAVVRCPACRRVDMIKIVELLLETPAGRRVAARIADPRLGLHVPHLIDVEVAQALRRYARDGDIDSAEAAGALDNLRALDLQRHEHEQLLDRVWSLRENLSAYDAVYIALAEALDTRVLTCDARMARAPGVSRRIELIEVRG